MSTMSLRIPESYHKRLRALAKRENISINQLITNALGEKIAALDTETYLEERAAKSSKKRFHKTLGKISDAKPSRGDEL